MSMWAGRKYKERAGCGTEDAWGQQRSENNIAEKAGRKVKVDRVGK